MFVDVSAKGLAKCLVSEGLEPDRLTVHISQIAPGARAHPPHTHEGVEAFCVLEGQGAIEVGGRRLAIGPNEAVVLDPTEQHGLVNTGSGTLRYMVIISRE